MAQSRLGYIILCDDHGKVGGKDCILGVFNRIFVQRFPALHQQCYLAFELWTTPGDHELGLEIRNTDGEAVEKPMGPLKMQVGPAGQGSGAIQLRGLPLKKAGIYSFVLTVDGVEVGIRELFVEPVRGGASPGIEGGAPGPA